MPMLFTHQQENKVSKTTVTVSGCTLQKRPPVSEKTKERVKEVFLLPLLAFSTIYLVIAITTLTTKFPHSPVLACSIGVSATILFTSPNSQFANAWPLLGGHLFSALVGISCVIYIPELALSAATAVGGAMLVMQLFRCMNPPGAATALAPIIAPHFSDALIYHFILLPILMNVLIIMLFSMMTKKLLT